MKTVAKKLYEAMFLVNSEQAADWQGINKTIEKILKRSEAEITLIKKWDERKLAYEINGQSRGTYILCYFKADPDRIQDIERDVRLSEKIIRVLVLNTEGRDKEDIEKDFSSQPKHSAEQQQLEAEDKDINNREETEQIEQEKQEQQIDD